MYGKVFASMYEGSLVGAGPVVFAVWGYCIAKADSDGIVLLNPALLAPIIGTSRQEIVDAVTWLTAPDPHSKNPEHEGRRLLNESGYQYLVVSHAAYRAIRNSDDRRDYMRDYMRRRRESDNGKEEPTVNEVNKELTELTSVSASASASEGGDSGGGGSLSPTPEDSPARKKVERKPYGEFHRVLLSDDEYAKLAEKRGESVAKLGIEVLDAWLERTGKRRKNHYACLNDRSWVWDKLAEQGAAAKQIDAPHSAKWREVYTACANAVWDAKDRSESYESVRSMLTRKYRNTPRLGGRDAVMAGIEMARNNKRPIGRSREGSPNALAGQGAKRNE